MFLEGLILGVFYFWFGELLNLLGCVWMVVLFDDVVLFMIFEYLVEFFNIFQDLKLLIVLLKVFVYLGIF